MEKLAATNVRGPPRKRKGGENPHLLIVNLC